MKRTMTRVKRIPLLALFFVSAMEFILERAGTDLVLMTGALAILLWGGLRRLLTVGRIALRFGRNPPPRRRAARRIARPAKKISS